MPQRAGRRPATSHTHGSPWEEISHSHDVDARVLCHMARHEQGCGRLSASSLRALRVPIARYGYKYPFTGYLLWQPFGQHVAAWRCNISSSWAVALRRDGVWRRRRGCGMWGCLRRKKDRDRGLVTVAVVCVCAIRGR